MTVRHAPFSGITQLGPGDPLSSDGYAFQDRDRAIIDALLRLGAVTHRHDAHAAMANPAAAATIAVNPTGGQIPAGLPIYLTYTLSDADGGETLPVATEAVTTDAGYVTPTESPTLALNHAAGTLLAGNFNYAATVRDGVGGETELGPVASVYVDPGNANSEVVVTNLAAVLASAGGAPGATWALWRQQDGGVWYLLGTGTINTFTDNGVAGDCSVTPPITGNTLGTSALSVLVPGGQPPEAAFFNIYASLDGSFSNPALLGTYPIADAGVAKIYTSLALTDGSPPVVSTCKPGANRIDANDLINLSIRSPVATAAALPTVGNGDGNLRVTLDDYAVHVWHAGTASWTSVGGSGGPTVLSGATSAQPSGDYTLSVTNDAGETVEYTGSAAQQVLIPAIPADPTADFRPGTMIAVTQVGTGSVTFGTPGAGIVIDSPTGSFAVAAQYGTVVARYRGLGEWVLSGDLAAGAGPAQLAGPALDLAYQAIVLADTPSLYYRLQKTSGNTPPTDSSGNGHDSTDFPAWGVYAPNGPFGPSDGSVGNGYVGIPASLSLNSSAAFTFEIMGKTANHAGNQTLLEIGDVKCLASDAGEANLVFTIGATTLTVPFPPNFINQWHHMLFVADDAEGKMGIWVDGVELGSTAWVAGAGAATNGVIGRLIAFGDNFTGPFAEAAIYPAALSDARIVAHALGSGLMSRRPMYVETVMTDAPAAFYTLDRTTGVCTLEPDISGNGHAATSPAGSADSFANYGAFTRYLPPLYQADYGSLNGSGFPLNLPAGLTVDTTGPFTLEAIFYPFPGGANAIAQLGTDVSISCPDGGGNVVFRVGASSVSVPIDGTWGGAFKLLTFVADDAAGQLAIWRNGVKMASAAWAAGAGVQAGGTLQANTPLGVGSENLSYVSIYQHALSDERIADHAVAAGL